MVAAPTPTQIRPETRLFRVEELIAHARAGRIRVPSFQFKWEREDVQQLIDSVWRGYPIGSLLLWSKPGPAGLVTLGDLAFDVSEQSSAWFVVDGQQRIVSLVSALIPGGGRAEKFDLYFDLETVAVMPPRPDGVPATYLPLNRVVDSEELLAWVDDHRAALAPEQARLAFRVGKMLREYELPASVVRVDDEAVVREIFLRINASGKALAAGEVFEALHAPMARKSKLPLKELIEDLRARTHGELDEDQALRDLLGLDQEVVTGNWKHQLKTVDPGAMEQIRRVLDRVFGFLAQDAGIPHFRLLPDAGQLRALGAYFDRFPTPSTRARRLLTRWLWRGAVTREPRRGSAVMRAALEALSASRSDEEAARAVLATVPARRSELMPSRPFDLRHARSRMSVIALAELRPHDLRTGAPLDVAGLLRSHGEVLHEIVATPSAAGVSPIKLGLFSSVGNRLLHPSIDDPPLRSLLDEAARAASMTRAASHVLASHAISAEAARALQAQDHVRFLELRRDQIEAATDRLIDRHAEWDHSDRPSIATLIDEED